MKVRILTAVILLPAFLALLLFLPPWCSTILFAVMTGLAAYELLWSTGLVKNIRLVAYAALMGCLVAVWSGLGAAYVWAVAGVLLFVALLFLEIMLSNMKLAFEKVILCVAGGLLIPFLLTALVRIRYGEHGAFIILIPLIIAFISDSGAYFAGRFFGKHKLAPTISPKKTVEGLIGGILAAVMSLLVFGIVLQFGFGFRVNYLAILLYGFVGAIAGAFGDLCLSAIKRQTGIKDYGKILPGHGGVLDRFDSMVFIAPTVEILMILIPMVVK